MNKASERQARYDATHTVRVAMKLNRTHDEDIINWLQDKTSKQGAIKEAIRAKIKEGE